MKRTSVSAATLAAHEENWESKQRMLMEEPSSVPEYLKGRDLHLCPHGRSIQLHRHAEVDADGQVPLSQVMHLHRGQ